jgi:hypothetical protein
MLPWAAAIAAALTLAGGDALAQGKGPSGTYIVKVRVVADAYVVVDQHPVVILEVDKVGRIVWELPANSAWRFENDGIAIDGGQFLGCRVEAKGLRFTCTDKPPPRKKELYPYRLTVHKDGKSIFMDSAVQND